MTTVVKKIKKTEYPISESKRKFYTEIGVAELIPHGTPIDLSFELHSTTTALANAIRRCGNSELSVSVMTFRDEDFKTDDLFIITHILKKRIMDIPISQTDKSRIFNVNVYNDTDEILTVYSGSIDSKDKKNIMFDKTFILTYLRPNCFIDIKNISIITNKACNDSACFSYPGLITMSCLDAGKSNMNTEPSKYRLIIPRQTWIDPINILKEIIQILLGKIEFLRSNMEDIKTDIITEYISISYTSEKITLIIENESYTIGNLIVDYSMKVDNTIQKAHCIRRNPTDKNIEIEITHPNPRSIILSAIVLIKKELLSINSAFE